MKVSQVKLNLPSFCNVDGQLLPQLKLDEPGVDQGRLGDEIDGLVDDRQQAFQKRLHLEKMQKH